MPKGLNSLTLNLSVAPMKGEPVFVPFPLLKEVLKGQWTSNGLWFQIPK